MDFVNKTNIILDSHVLGRCPTCGEVMYKGEYLLYFIQQGTPNRLDPFRINWRNVPLKELQKKYGEDPNFPEQLKSNSEFAFLPFDKRSCIRPIVDFLNTKEKNKYRYSSHYGIITTPYEGEEEEENE